MPEQSASVQNSERLIRLEEQFKNLEKEQTTTRNDLIDKLDEVKSDVDKKFDLVFDKFGQYVRLERYKVVEVAVFGVIGLMTTSVILALIALVMRTSGQ